MKTIVSLLLAGSLSLFFSQCNQSNRPEEKNSTTSQNNIQEIKNDGSIARQEFIDQMQQMRDKMARQIEKLDRRLENADEKAKQELEKNRANLKKELAQLDEAFEQAAVTASSDWESFRKNVEAAFEEIEADLKAFGEEMK